MNRSLKTPEERLASMKEAQAKMRASHTQVSISKDLHKALKKYGAEMTGRVGFSMTTGQVIQHLLFTVQKETRK